MKVGSEKLFVYKIPYSCARSTFRLGVRKQRYFANKEIIGKTALVFVCKIPLLARAGPSARSTTKYLVYKIRLRDKR